MSKLRIKIKYEKPNPYLYNFTGSLIMDIDSQEIPLDNSNFVLRGCSLRNTSFAYGIVAYTGYYDIFL